MLSITFSPPDPYISSDGTNVVVQTNDVTQVGPHAITMYVGLADYPMVTPLSKPFQVSITCSLSSLAFNNPPTLIVQRPGVDSEPFVVFFQITQSCGVSPTFTLSQTSGPYYSGAATPANDPVSNGVNFRITGASRADAGLYHYSMTAVSSDVQAVTAFDW